MPNIVGEDQLAVRQPGGRPHEVTVGRSAASRAIASASAVAAERDTCVLFADGLPFDVGAILLARLEAQGLRPRIRVDRADTNRYGNCV